MAKKAREAAEWINDHPETSPEKLAKVMPEFQLDLHRRSWIALFFKYLNKDLHESFVQYMPLKKVTVGIDPILLSTVNSKTNGIESIINDALLLYLKSI